MKHKLLPLAFFLFVSFSISAQINHVQSVKQYLLSKGFTQTDVEEVQVTDQYTSKHNGVTHVYFRQKYKGIEVYNAVGAIHFKQHKVVSGSHNFISNIDKKVNAADASINANAAIAATASHLNLKQPAALGKTSLILVQNKAVLNDLSVSPEPLKVGIYYYVVSDEVKLVYNTNWLDPETNNWWDVRVDALTGAVIDKNNLTNTCGNHEHKQWNEGAANTSAVNKSYDYGKKSDGSSRYNALPLFIESPLHGDRALLTDPSDSLASPFGWHDTDGVAGAEQTITAGNNVIASDDINAQNVPGYSPDGGDSLIFDFPYDTAGSPQNNLDAVTTNLFVWNNYMHDVMYHYGFDEESGNFQLNNYGRGGGEGDRVMADAQDGSGLNNANFATPPDGQSPRMQMYLWTKEVPYLVFRTPLYTDSVMFYVSEFGLRRFEEINGELALAKTLNGTSTLACSEIENVAGKIVVIDRGTCSFATKIKIAQDAGAIAAVVINNSNNTPTSMTGNDSTITIPSFIVSKAKGDKLRLWLTTDTVTGTLRKTIFDRALDSDMDNGVIAHEYGHGISTRLTGGASTSSCLYNLEQAGEGWSDFFCLYMTHRDSELPGHARGIGVWLDNEPITGVGIRNFRYSTDMTMNPYTYNSIRTAAVPHGVGAVWCTMLYDLYWNMIDKYGYDSNLYSGKGGNNRTLQLVIDGLKLQPCTPGFVDARDAILLADELYNNGADSELIWKTFARRGLGFSAKQGASTSVTDGTQAFDVPEPQTGLSYINKLSKISFWPNPNNGTFEVMLPENTNSIFVTILDISGKTVYAEKLSGNETVKVETSHLQNGLYILKAEANGVSYTNKLMVAH